MKRAGFYLFGTVLLAGCASTPDAVRTFQPMTAEVAGEPQQAAECIAPFLDEITWGVGFSAVNTIRASEDAVSIVGHGGGVTLWVVDLTAVSDDRSQASFHVGNQLPLYHHHITQSATNALAACG